MGKLVKKDGAPMWLYMCKVQVKIKDTDGGKKQGNEMELIRRDMKMKCILNQIQDFLKHDSPPRQYFLQ